MAGYVAEVLGPNFNFGVDDRPGIEGVQRASEVLFAEPVAVIGRVVEVSDS